MSAAVTCGFMGDAPSVDSRDAVCCNNSTSFLSAASSCWLQPSRKGNSRGNRCRPNGCDANLPVRGSPHEKGGGETPDCCGRCHPIVKLTVSHREGRIPTLDEIGSRRKVLVVFQLLPMIGWSHHSVRLTIAQLFDDRHSEVQIRPIPQPFVLHFCLLLEFWLLTMACQPR